jgi:acylphosphatase
LRRIQVTRTGANAKQVKAKVIEIVASSKEEALEKFKELVKEGKIV